MKRQARRILESLMGPTGSVILHIVIVVVLLKVVFFDTRAKETDIEVLILEPVEADLDEIKNTQKTILSKLDV